MRVVARCIRTANFSRRVKRLLVESEIAALERSISERPDAHPVVAGTGSIRKARWGRAGIGKRGGVRAVHYCLVRADLVYMLDILCQKRKV